MLPNFLIAGGVATGTSFLSATIAQHPDIYLPRIQRPEPNFFHYSWKFERGIDWYQKTWFSEVKGQKAVGERSSLQLPSNVAAKRMKKFIPEAKIIFCLRNPIERAWGNYRFTVLEGLEPLSFAEALDQEEDRMQSAEGIWKEVQPHAYVARGKYASCLEEYFDLFGRNNILLLKSEDMGRNPHEHIAKVCEFLGVDSMVKLPLPPNYSSPSVRERSVQVEVRSYFGDRYPELVESIRIEQDVSSLLYNDEDLRYAEMLKGNLVGGKDPLPEQMRARLQSVYASEILNLSHLVDFSVADWK